MDQISNPKLIKIPTDSQRNMTTVKMSTMMLSNRTNKEDPNLLRRTIISLERTTRILKFKMLLKATLLITIEGLVLLLTIAQRIEITREMKRKQKPRLKRAITGQELLLPLKSKMMILLAVQLKQVWIILKMMMMMKKLKR